VQFFAMVDISQNTMKVYKLKRKYRGIIANMNLDCLKLILITILPWLIKVYMSGYTQQELLGNNANRNFLLMKVVRM
jgi:hypothetical protein